MLATKFFTVNFPVAVCKTIVEISDLSLLIAKLEATFILDTYTVNFTPMIAILFIWTWMRGLQIDPKHGKHQRRAQVCLHGYTVFVYAQTLVAIFMPFCTEFECKEGDVVIVMENQKLEAVVTAIRYHTHFGPYGGFTAVNYSVFLMPHSTDVSLTPPILKLTAVKSP